MLDEKKIQHIQRRKHVAAGQSSRQALPPDAYVTQPRTIYLTTSRSIGRASVQPTTAFHQHTRIHFLFCSSCSRGTGDYGIGIWARRWYVLGISVTTIAHHANPTRPSRRQELTRFKHRALTLLSLLARGPSMLRHQHQPRRRPRKGKVRARPRGLLRVSASQEGGASLHSPSPPPKYTPADFHTGRTNPCPPSCIPQGRSQNQTRRCPQRRGDPPPRHPGCPA